MNPICACGKCGLEVTKPQNKFRVGHCNTGKITKGFTGRKHSDYSKLRISKNSGWIGRKHTQEELIKISNSQKGRKHKVESNLKNSLWHTGRKMSAETIEKMSKSHTGIKRVPHTEQSKIQMSVSAKKRINIQSKNLGSLYPREGKNERFIIESIYNTLNRKEFLLRNNQLIYKKCKRFPDNYDSGYNISVDVLEKHHFKRNGELSDYDQIRQLEIANGLGCMIYYIIEKEFLDNPEKEILRFKDFLSLLDQGRN